MMRPSLRTHGIRSSRSFHTTATRPSGLSTRAISGRARSRSNQWNACAATTTSTERVAAGIASAGAVAVRRSGCRSRRWVSISSSGSVASTSWPRSRSRSVNLPVPAPSSTTVAMLRPVIHSAASAGYDGRARSYCSATAGEGQRRLGRGLRREGSGRRDIVQANLPWRVALPTVPDSVSPSDPAPVPGPGSVSDSPSDPLAELASLEGVGSGMAAARDGIDALLRDRGLRRTAPELTGESLLRGAHASAVLEGSASSLDDVREGRADEHAAAALRVSTELLGLVPVLAHSPLQALARLHILAAKGVAGRRRPRPTRWAPRRRSVSAGLGQAAAGQDLRLPRWCSPPSCTPSCARWRRSPRTTGSWPAPRSGWCWSLGEWTRRRSPCRRPGTSSCARRTSRTWTATPRAVCAGVHSWLLYAAEAFTKGADASPLRDGWP